VGEEKMNPKIQLAIKISVVIVVIALTSFITKKSERWFPPRTEIKVVFSDSTFAGVPLLRPIKDKTVYLFDKCDFTGKRWGEQITSSEVDEAIDKLDKLEGKK
jgi:hypothetical protein